MKGLCSKYDKQSPNAGSPDNGVEGVFSKKLELERIYNVITALD
jgi:hypothetical protein